jgi:hypothetical protein
MSLRNFKRLLLNVTTDSTQAKELVCVSSTCSNSDITVNNIETLSC